MALTTDDKVAIQELLARRNQGADFADPDAWAATWATDGVLELPEGTVLNMPNGPTMDPRIAGRDNLRAFVASLLPQLDGSRHWINSIVIDGDGESAHSICYFSLVNVETGGTPVHTGIYYDTHIKIDGEWLTQHRRVTFDL